MAAESVFNDDGTLAYISENFANTTNLEAPKTGLAMLDNLAGWLLHLTAQQALWIVLIFWGLGLVMNRKKIMGGVRAHLLTPEGLISALVHATIVIGLFKIYQTFS